VSARQILRMGHPQLMSPSSPVDDFSDSELTQVIQDMYDTMHAEGGVGIAAPQIGNFKRILMFGFEHNDSYPDMQPIPFSIFINSVIEVIDSTLEEGWEGKH
jgi:peptide deformylase